MEETSPLAYLRKKAASLPLSPGVYLMKDQNGGIIYVGKSKKLKNRVSSYFIGKHNVKTEKMVGLVRDFDFILCDTEMEALTLENLLIKKHTPKYNIKLKDAKSYPYIKVEAGDFPHLYVTRQRKNDRGHYFGPYSGAAQAYGALEAVSKIFSLATCRRRFPRDIGKERPCLYAQMGRCVAPCTGKITAEEYGRLVRSAEWVLDGNVKGTKEILSAEMETAAEEMRFEQAAGLRDSIRALDALCEKQKVVADGKVNRDVFALYVGETEAVLAVLSVRGGALLSKNEFMLENGWNASTEDALNLIVDYYDSTSSIPPQIYLDFPLEDEDAVLLGEYLSVSSGRKTEVRIPQRGEGRALCDLAMENAKEQAHQARLAAEREDKDVKRLAELIGLAEVPRRIEAYDISNFGNENIVASMVVYADGKMKKSDYRLFSIRSTDGADDYASMREALSRRIAHIGDGSASLGDAPDLILLDGGETHVRTGLAVLNEHELDVPMLGMVKDDYHKTRALTDGEHEISIAKEQNVYAFIYKIQEEAHRFAIKSSHAQKEKTMKKSSLEEIPGIGPAKAKALLREMTISEIREADVEKLAAVKGITETDAKTVAEYFTVKKAGKKEKKQ